MINKKSLSRLLQAQRTTRGPPCSPSGQRGPQNPIDRAQEAMMPRVSAPRGVYPNFERCLLRIKLFLGISALGKPRRPRAAGRAFLLCSFSQSGPFSSSSHMLAHEGQLRVIRAPDKLTRLGDNRSIDFFSLNPNLDGLSKKLPEALLLRCDKQGLRPHRQRDVGFRICEPQSHHNRSIRRERCISPSAHRPQSSAHRRSSARRARFRSSA